MLVLTETDFRDCRERLDSVSTTFRNAVEGPTEVALEWDGHALLAGGHPIIYSGVTVLDLDASQDAIAGLRTYYDTVAFTWAPVVGA